ncbi:MAG: cell wall-binding repeat-containing protein, partial [Actinomycetota bacterium]|nr:cell wall-binding repeat-containing protein [Actinomycetota bacterium]
AAARGVPIYLASRGGLSPATKAAMVSAGVKEVVVLGRSGAVSDAVERELKNTFGEENVDRVGGENRYATAVLVAQGGVDRAKLSWYKFAVATGEDFPDALAGGVLQGRDLSVLVLTKRNQLPAEVEASLVANKEIVREMRVLGGQNAVHQDVRNRVWLALQ